MAGRQLLDGRDARGFECGGHDEQEVLALIGEMVITSHGHLRVKVGTSQEEHSIAVPIMIEPAIQCYFFLTHYSFSRIFRPSQSKCLSLAIAKK